MDFERYCLLHDCETNQESQKKYDKYLANIARQKAYRKRHRDDKAHVNMLVNREVKLQFDLLTKYYAITGIELFETLVNDREKALLAIISEKDKDKYFGVT